MFLLSPIIIFLSSNWTSKITINFENTTKTSISISRKDNGDTGTLIFLENEAYAEMRWNMWGTEYVYFQGYHPNGVSKFLCLSRVKPNEYKDTSNNQLEIDTNKNIVILSHSLKYRSIQSDKREILILEPWTSHNLSQVESYNSNFSNSTQDFLNGLSLLSAINYSFFFKKNYLFIFIDKVPSENECVKMSADQKSKIKFNKKTNLVESIFLNRNSIDALKNIFNSQTINQLTTINILDEVRKVLA